MPPIENPFSSFSAEDQAAIQDQLTTLYGSGKLNPAQQTGVQHALRHITAARGLGVPVPAELQGPGTNRYEAAPGSDSPEAQQTRLGQMVPEGAEKPLAVSKKLLVDPFEAAAKFGANTGRDIVNEAAVGYDTLRHPNFAASPYGPISVGPTDAEQLARQEQEHPIASGAQLAPWHRLSAAR
jgi:hypothetical protein